MKTNLPPAMNLMTLLVPLLLLSCGPTQTTDEARDAADTTSTAMHTTPSTSPQHMMYVVHDVANFDTFKKEFDAHEALRQQNGLTVISLMRDLDNLNKIHVALAAADISKARAFAASEDLKNAMQKAGVVGAPAIYFLNSEFADLAASDNANRVIVMHRVTDYAAWKSVFDGHKAKRQEIGLTDRLVARVDGDPNQVALSFLPSDLNKAREFSASEELKNTMQKGGVEGAPTISFVSVVK